MDLKKAWDKEALIEGLKAQGLPVLEDSAEKIAATFFEWAKASVDLEGGMIATVGTPILVAAEKLALGQIDKIDGVEG